MIIEEVVIIMNQIKGRSIMNSIAIFWLIVYTSWVTIEFIAKEYRMKRTTRTTLLAICTPILAGIIAISCSGNKEKEPELSFNEQMDIKYAHVQANHDSINVACKEYHKELDEEHAQKHQERFEYKVDSSKIIAIRYPDDEFTDFEEAFATARGELGKDKHFIWLNKIYSTNYKEEGYPDGTSN